MTPLQELLNSDLTTEYKKVLCEKYRIPIKVVARYLDLSYSHTVNILNGTSRITPDVKSKLNSLILEAEGSAR